LGLGLKFLIMGHFGALLWLFLVHCWSLVTVWPHCFYAGLMFCPLSFLCVVSKKSHIFCILSCCWYCSASITSFLLHLFSLSKDSLGASWEFKLVVCGKYLCGSIAYFLSDLEIHQSSGLSSQNGSRFRMHDYCICLEGFMAFWWSWT